MIFQVVSSPSSALSQLWRAYTSTFPQGLLIPAVPFLRRALQRFQTTQAGLSWYRGWRKMPTLQSKVLLAVDPATLRLLKPEPDQQGIPHPEVMPFLHADDFRIGGGDFFIVGIRIGEIHFLGHEAGHVKVIGKTPPRREVELKPSATIDREMETGVDTVLAHDIAQVVEANASIKARRNAGRLRQNEAVCKLEPQVQVAGHDLGAEVSHPRKQLARLTRALHVFRYRALQVVRGRAIAIMPDRVSEVQFKGGIQVDSEIGGDTRKTHGLEPEKAVSQVAVIMLNVAARREAKTIERLLCEYSKRENQACDQEGVPFHDC